MANSPSGVRQDKTRYFVADLETTVGTLVFDPASATGSELIFPARADSRLGVSDADALSNSDALDGIAGEVASTRGAMGRGGTLMSEIRDYSGQNPFPPFVKQLLASGFEAASASTNITLTPSTKAITNWPGETAGARSPASMSIVEVDIDNNTADEWKAAAGCVLKTKMVLGTNEEMMITSEIVGLVHNGKLVEIGTTDLSGFGAQPTGQGAAPIVMKGATWTWVYVDSTGSTGITVARPKALEIEFTSSVVRVEDPTATNGYAVAAVFWETAPTVTVEFADSAAITEDIHAGFYSQDGFLGLTVAIDTNTAASRTLTVAVPRIQYDAERTNGDGARMWSIAGRAVREENGNATAPVTITWDYGTP